MTPDGRTSDLGLLLLAAMVIGLVGAYALIYPNTQGGLLALGALLPIAGAIANHYFQQRSTSAFLGQMTMHQNAQDALVSTVLGTVPASPTTPSGSTGSLPPPTTSATPKPAGFGPG